MSKIFGTSKSSGSDSKSSGGDSNSFVLRNVKVFNSDNGTFSAPSDVEVAGGVIKSVKPTSSSQSSGQSVVDGKGHWLLPGLIDSHAHADKPHHLNTLTSYGVTSIVTMAINNDGVKNLNDNPKKLQVTDYKYATTPLIGKGATHQMICQPEEQDIISDPSQARDWVRNRINEGSNHLKIICETGGPSKELVAAVIQEGATADPTNSLKAVIHTADYESAVEGITAGASVVTHVPTDKTLDDDTLRLLGQHENPLSIPTLTMLAGTAKLHAMIDQIKALIPKDQSASDDCKSESSPCSYDFAVETVKATKRVAPNVAIHVGTDCNPGMFDSDPDGADGASTSTSSTSGKTCSPDASTKPVCSHKLEDMLSTISESVQKIDFSKAKPPASTSQQAQAKGPDGKPLDYLKIILFFRQLKAVLDKNPSKDKIDGKKILKIMATATAVNDAIQYVMNLINDCVHVPYGSSVHDELQRLVAAGLSPAEVLRAATSEPAKYWNWLDRGEVKQGKRADLLLVGGDPLQDISNTTKIEGVWVNGYQYQKIATGTDTTNSGSSSSGGLQFGLPGIGLKA